MKINRQEQYEIYHDLDTGIADVVHLLRTNDVNTFSSCQGGAGHSFINPTVRIIPQKKDDPWMVTEIDFISGILKKAGYGCFTLKACYGYQADGLLADFFIELEFLLYAEQITRLWFFWKKIEQVVRPIS